MSKRQTAVDRAIAHLEQIIVNLNDEIRIRRAAIDAMKAERANDQPTRRHHRKRVPDLASPNSGGFQETGKHTDRSVPNED